MVTDRSVGKEGEVWGVMRKPQNRAQTVHKHTSAKKKKKNNHNDTQRKIQNNKSERARVATKISLISTHHVGFQAANMLKSPIQILVIRVHCFTLGAQNRNDVILLN